MSHAKISGLHFARVGGGIVNLSSISTIDLPPADSPDGVVTVNTVGGSRMTVSGEDAEWLLKAIESRCDVSEQGRAKKAKSQE